MNLEFRATLNQDNEWHMQKHHFHEHYEILLSLTDAGKIFIGNQVFPLKKGTLMLVKNTTLHKTIAKKNIFYERFVVHFPVETIRNISTSKTNLFYTLCESNKCIQLEQNQLFDVLPYFKNVSISENNNFGSDIRKYISFLDLMLKLSEYLNPLTTSNKTNSAEFELMTPIIDYIQNNLNSNLSLDFLSEKFYISKYYLCKKFKNSTGFTVREFIINNRIIKAKELLKKGYSVQKTGELSGFNNYSHFIRSFGKLIGKPPGKYKSSL